MEESRVIELLTGAIGATIGAGLILLWLHFFASTVEREATVREEPLMPRWGERMDRLEHCVDEHCTLTSATDTGVFVDRSGAMIRIIGGVAQEPTHDPYAATRATAAQGMARPHWRTP